MDHLVLSKGFLVGHPEVDAEHAQLVALLNDAIDVVTGKGAFSTLQAKVDALYQALQRHVVNEELLMDRLGYDIQVEEKKYHQEGLVKFSGLMAEHADGAFPEDYVRSLKNLLVVTFLKTDMGLKGYLPEACYIG